ncbi:MAG: ABC transporter permease [Candidatus Rokubacteria bacterium]|nr:ABC transporter permease [Candidatus Rokubacteria bacterium]
MASTAPSRLEELWRSLRRGKGALVGAGLLLLLILAAIFAPLVAPHEPVQAEITQRLRPPVWAERGTTENLLGTDQLGRDVLSRTIYGSRVSLIVGITAVLISGTLGVSLGLISAFQGGRLDALVMRVADVQLAFPFILLAIAVVAVVGGGLLNVILILGVTGWVSYGRVVRSQALSVKEKEYVEAARALGSRSLVLVFRHILPNVMTPVIVLATFNVASYMVAEASLTFLGLGVQPAIPSWGIMLADGREYMRAGWWMAIFPGLALMLTVLSINLVGDWLREYLDPRLRHQE